MSDELKEVKYFKEITDFYNVKYFIEIKRSESSKSRDVFKTQTSMYDGTFLRIYLTAHYFSNKSSIIHFGWFMYRPPKILKLSR